MAFLCAEWDQISRDVFLAAAKKFNERLKTAIAAQGGITLKKKIICMYIRQHYVRINFRLSVIHFRELVKNVRCRT